ncbi:uncharacterized protein [Diadema antillarum]|uniref:uncharacterized protein n=1 Tax=Diadema antillarum TaxID=105358 RepID=UPI003A8625AF
MSKQPEGSFNVTRDYEKFFDTSLLVAMVYRCKICKMHTARSDEMRHHLRLSHAESVGNTIADSAGNVDVGASEGSMGRVFKEIQNTVRTKCPPSYSDLKVRALPSDVKSGDLSVVGRRLRNRRTAISNALKLLLEDSVDVEIESEGRGDKIEPCKDQHRLHIDTASQGACKESVDNDTVCSENANPSQNEEQVFKQFESSEDSRVVENLKRDVTRTLLEAAKLMQEDKSRHGGERKEGLATEEFSKGNQKAREDGAFSEEVAPTAPESSDSGDGNQDSDWSLCDTPNDIVQSPAAEKDSSIQHAAPTSKVPAKQIAEEPKAESSGVQEGAGLEKSGAEGGGSKQPSPQAEPKLSLYSNVDFQAIAQRASQSNPEATTITVVQHTGSDKPPTTIHFRKSRKSDAIIPTGESLGITSPFLRKEYAGSKIFACKECHSRYKTQNELERHITKKHKKEKSYLCEICGDALATRCGMKLHILRKHGATSILKCDVCSYTTRSPIRLEVHIKKHNKAKLEHWCEPCKKSFVTASKLQQHKNSPMHKNNVDPIICEHCGYITKKRDNFLVHLRKHTGEKPYKCSHCNYAAADGSTLKRHVMARHSTIRPFRCSQCQFSCVDKKGLTIHMRKHTGERPYTCDLCPYSAKRMGALTVHQRTHLRSKSLPSDEKEDVHLQKVEVASYVDISDIPMTQLSYTNVNQDAGYSSQLAVTQQQDSVVGMATECTVLSVDQSGAVTLPSEVMVAQETDQSVRALWQSIS